MQLNMDADKDSNTYQNRDFPRFLVARMSLASPANSFWQCVSEWHRFIHL